MVTSLQNRLWDIECWRSAFTMPSDGAFSIFYRGCKQSNLSTYTALVGFSVAKVIVFYLFAVICRAFFSKAIFFNFFPHSALWVAWQLEYPFFVCGWLQGYSVHSSRSCFMLFPLVGCMALGAISANGSSTKLRLCINGCGTMRRGASTTSLPQSRISMSMMRSL